MPKHAETYQRILEATNEIDSKRDSLVFIRANDDSTNFPPPIPYETFSVYPSITVDETLIV